MNIRERQELNEKDKLSKYASLSSSTKGRKIKEDECDIRTCYQRDRDRILHSKSFRRLKDKTQVFISPVGDHYRTRLMHSLEVAQTARTIARALRLNDDLTEAIALGHDLGHTPFGHTGEKALSDIAETEFIHSEQSVRVVEFLEKNGKGLNLTYEVIDGIRNHQTEGKPNTLEGKIVRISDKIAYINSDIDDAIRAEIITENDLPKDICDILGHSSDKRLNTIIHDVVAGSLDKNDICMSADIQDAMSRLRAFMFENVYLSTVAKKEDGKAIELIQRLYMYYKENFDKLPVTYKNLYYICEDKSRIICDYIAGMTDSYAIELYRELFIPKGWGI